MFKFRTDNYLLMSLLIFCLGCEQNEDLHKNIIEPKCINNQSICEKSVMSGDFSILFNVEPVITETPFDISFVYNGKYRIKNITAHMEGKNMFMGKVPLFFEHQKNKHNAAPNDHDVDNVTHRANTMLGSCSEEQMRWIIFFKVTLENFKKELVLEEFTVEFDSVRY